MKKLLVMFLLALNCLGNIPDDSTKKNIQIIFKNLGIIFLQNKIESTNRQEAERIIEESLTELEKFSSDKTCSADNICKTAAVGDYNTCSEPAGYLIYSKEKVDEAEFLKRIEAHNKLTRDYANRYLAGVVSTCAINMSPTILCLDGKCGKADGLFKNLQSQLSMSSQRKCSSVNHCRAKMFTDNSCDSKKGYIIYSTETFSEPNIDQEIGYYERILGNGGRIWISFLTYCVQVSLPVLDCVTSECLASP